jgi:hypothetical protein
MKVTSSDAAALTGTAQAASIVANSATARARTAGAQKSSDNVQLSNLSGHLRALTAEGRQAHLDGLEAIVASGQYKPDSSAISAQIIQQSMRSGAAA